MNKHGWTYKKLGEVATLYDSQRKPVTKKDRVSGMYPYYGATGIQDYVDSYIFDGRYLLLGEDGAKWGANEKSAFIIEGKSWVNNHAHIMRFDERVNDSFVEYYLNGKDLNEYITGAVVPKLTQAKLTQILIPVPPIDEQERIVAELDLLSSVSEKKKAQLSEYDQLAQSIYYSMFGDPKRWDNMRLKDVMIKMGSGATPRGGNQSYKNEGISLIRSLNVHNGIFKIKDLAYIDEFQAAQLNNVIVEKNDVLLNITGASVARCCIVPSNILPARVNQHVSILRPNIDILNHVFLCHYLISDTAQEALILMSKSKAATREALPKSVLETFLIPIPPLSLQQQFAERIEAIEKQKALVQASIAETETLFNSRMDYYFG